MARSEREIGDMKTNPDTPKISRRTVRISGTTLELLRVFTQGCGCHHWTFFAGRANLWHISRTGFDRSEPLTFVYL